MVSLLITDNTVECPISLVTMETKRCKKSCYYFNKTENNNETDHAYLECDFK